MIGILTFFITGAFCRHSNWAKKKNWAQDRHSKFQSVGIVCNCVRFSFLKLQEVAFPSFFLPVFLNDFINFWSSTFRVQPTQHHDVQKVQG